MKFKPGSDLMEAGEYDASVVTATERVSQNSGNEMIELQIEVYDTAGEGFAVTDYLVSTRKMQWKLRHFCESAGLDYEKGDLEAPALEGVNVRVSVEKVKDVKYGWQNKISDYLPRTNGAAARPAKAADPIDADIPF